MHKNWNTPPNTILIKLSSVPCVVNLFLNRVVMSSRLSCNIFVILTKYANSTIIINSHKIFISHLTCKEIKKQKQKKVSVSFRLRRVWLYPVLFIPSSSLSALQGSIFHFLRNNENYKDGHINNLFIFKIIPFLRLSLYVWKFPLIFTISVTSINEIVLWTIWSYSISIIVISFHKISNESSLFIFICYSKLISPLEFLVP